MNPIGLSDRAMQLVQRHAKALPLDQRDGFLEERWRSGLHRSRPTPPWFRL